MKSFLLTVLLCAVTLFSLAQQKKKPIADTVQLKKAITGFYAWYNSNWDKTTAFRLYKKAKASHAPFYKVDWQQVNRYLHYFRQTGYLTDSLLRWEKNYYTELDSMFHDLIKEDLPSFVLNGYFTMLQRIDPRMIYRELTKKDTRWVFDVLPDGTATVFVSNNENPDLFCCDMRKEKGRWKILSPICDLQSKIISN